ncbi:ATP-binding cassette domain-containing protein, partial [Streptomyces sp. SID7499]|nr:ATP-binding cassette domain-containing protein [Streptomyces sp. SID7499]
MDGNNGTGHGRVVAALDGVGMRRHTTGQVILDSVGWTVRAGEHWALLGPNGAGKTSILRLVGATAFPTTG